MLLPLFQKPFQFQHEEIKDGLRCNFALPGDLLLWLGGQGSLLTGTMEKTATHIVVGKVQAVYSYKEREGIPVLSGYEYDHKVAEVKIEKVEKGKITESLVHARYLESQPEGLGLPPPGGQSYENHRKKGEFAAFTSLKMLTTAGQRDRKMADTTSFTPTESNRSKSNIRR